MLQKRTEQIADNRTADENGWVCSATHEQWIRKDGSRTAWVISIVPWGRKLWVMSVFFVIKIEFETFFIGRSLSPDSG